MNTLDLILSFFLVVSTAGCIAFAIWFGRLLEKVWPSGWD